MKRGDFIKIWADVQEARRREHQRWIRSRDEAEAARIWDELPPAERRKLKDAAHLSRLLNGEF